MQDHTLFEVYNEMSERYGQKIEAVTFSPPHVRV